MSKVVDNRLRNSDGGIRHVKSRGEHMNAAERKKAQRQRDKINGWQEVTVRVSATQAQAVRDFAAGLPDPAPPTDPRQLELLSQIERDMSL
jgi:hypothetical protein